MPSCLGLYIDSKIIKYAKITKDKSSTKIDSFGLKTYENLQETIEQIISETSSQKIPIAVNTSGEEYHKLKIFNLLSSKDIENVMKTEFESFSEERNRNKDAFEYRYILAEDYGSPDKIRAISVITNKVDLTNKTNQLANRKVIAIAPLGITIANLLKPKKKENALIVNIEEKTTVTTIVNEKIYDVETMDIGAIDILENINKKENSYSKSYEICKNATIYTNENKDLQYDENQYIDEIMPALYEIVGRIRKITNESFNKINKIYITGTASVINNIDIYFQEYLSDIECEILRPAPIKKTNNKINIKDYIEVNSAISLALFGLGEGVANVNFKKSNFLDKIQEKLNVEKKVKSEELNIRLENSEKNLIKLSAILFATLLMYMVGSGTLTNMINDRQKETDQSMAQMQEQIDKASKDRDIIKERLHEYNEMVDGIKEVSQVTTENERYKNTIPTLLSEIMFVIPKNVQLTSIRNTSDSHVEIIVQAERYEQIGYFKGRLKTDNILTNVISDSGLKNEGVIVVTIEGELP